MAVTRRQFLKRTIAVGAVASVGGLGNLLVPRAAHAVNNSGQLAKWIQALRGLTALGDPNGIPVLNGVPDPVFANTTLYQVTAGEFTDQLHPAISGRQGCGGIGTPPTRSSGISAA